MAPLLEVKNLSVSFRTENGPVQVVRDVSFTLAAGEIAGLVGESGSGKSVLSFAVMGLLPRDSGFIDSGEILFGGRNLPALPRREMGRIRGREISMIFQEPMTSLNPVYTIGNQLDEVFVNHGQRGRSVNRKRSIELLERVGIPRATEIARSYPHQLSGGMRQRVMIAMAMALSPKLLIADEPTTALDVTIQAQILRLIEQLARENGMAVIFISHNLGVVARLCRKVMVMYSSQIVEITGAERLYQAPAHPYTKNLLECIPQIGMSGRRLSSIEGAVPHPGDEITGCRFAARCGEAEARCRAEAPELRRLADGLYCRCLKRETSGEWRVES
ncbi:MAG: ABC transporter ATP-binding protein [Gracilibacteraceae bacterium]|jgi:oligopeptide/dipeptide ABC transporter ATP-binding protein|nr:ABC transporter ATP-binding protein [Gracilibacteraceae bacterium]